MPRWSARGVIIGIGAVFFLVAVFGRGVASFYIDALWFSALGRSDVFWGQIGAKVTLFALFFVVFLVLAGINLFVADRLAPPTFPANMHPYVERFHELFGQRLRLVRYGTAAVLALLLALPAMSNWRQWILFRNAQSFGVADPEHGVDVGFYVFRLPFIGFVVDWLFAAILITLVLTLIVHLLNGGVVFISSAPAVRAATKAHLAVLLAVLAVAKAGDYWVSRYELMSARTGIVDGATYSIINARLPAVLLLVLVAVLTALLYLSTIRTGNWRLPLLASAMWLLVSIGGGIAYPALVESLVVQPNQEAREAPFIERNVEATRTAMGIDEVVETDVEFSRLNSEEVASDLEPIRNVRLLNPTQMLRRFTIDVGEAAGLQISDLDIDRYPEGDTIEQHLITARELDLGSIPNKSWVGRHLVSTRGCGLVSASVSKVTSSGQPVYERPELDRPQLYFSPTMSGYGIVGTSVGETPCGDDSEYSGNAGVEMGGFFRRAAMALSFLEYNIVGSGAMESDSQLLWIRSVTQRAKKVAPFLSFDNDPYPMIHDGAVKWIIDGYTSTSNYPYAEAVDDVQLSEQTGIPGAANYVRNSVKAVIDAYTGEVTLYVVDEQDPILEAWRSAFPDLFTDGDEMPNDIREHLRYPEDLFRIQTDFYSKYRIAPENFFQRRGAWSISQAPNAERRETSTTSATTTGGAVPVEERREVFATESDTKRFEPYYTMFDSEQTDGEEFVIFRPFVPFSPDDRRTELQAYMTASADPHNYGELVSYVVTNQPPILGPYTMADRAENNPDISEQLTLQANEESGVSVRFGDMQVVPVADGLLYMRPVYVVASSNTEYRFIIVSHDNDSVMRPTIDAALLELFPGYDGNVGERLSADDGDPVDPDTEETAGSDEIPADTAELLDQAADLYDEAQQLLADGDLGAYQEKIDEMADLINRASEQLSAVTPDTDS